MVWGADAGKDRRKDAGGSDGVPIAQILFFIMGRAQSFDNHMFSYV